MAVAGAAVTTLLPAGVASAATLADNVVYRVVDGVSITLDIYQPTTPGPHPGILLIHGAWDHETKESYSDLGTQLAEDGFVVYADRKSVV